MRLGEWDIPEPASDPADSDAMQDEVIGLMSPIGEALVGAGMADPVVLRRYEALGAGAMLARLWRDVRRDVMQRGRVYIPQDIARQNGLDLALMRKALKLDADRGCDGDARDGSCDCANSPNTGMRVVLPVFRETMHGLVVWADALLNMRDVKPAAIPDDLRKALHRIRVQGNTDLRLIRRRRYDTLTRRPKPNVADKLLASVSSSWLS